MVIDSHQYPYERRVFYHMRLEFLALEQKKRPRGPSLIGFGTRLNLETKSITAGTLLAILSTECSGTATVGTIPHAADTMTNLAWLLGRGYSRSLDNAGSGAAGAVAKSALANAFFAING